MTDTAWPGEGIDPERASAARIYDYILGGGHNFAVDRDMAEQVLDVNPDTRRHVQQNRAFLRRAVLFMMQQGIRQFLDLGSGIPTVGNVHEIAQAADPRCRVVYVDIDPVAVAHSEMLLADNPNAAIIRADVARPDLVLRSPVTRRLLDFARPVGLLALTIGHYLAPAQQPFGIFAAYRDQLAPGSHLAVSHVTNELTGNRADIVAEMMRKAKSNSVFPRNRDEVLRFFDGYQLVEPGLVTTSRWRPELPEERLGDAGADGQYAGVARKP
ncbi:SAM-dependent methyltransferase [Labedaea rhizosphaerae]|uniref:S-adenosyl methyltransferase n=1 Tax=Labedaea rhizosphaerae TaxID=598644 RepID=A0A4R6SCR4_LABRH|nr:SAM-dependent methyltransferase [Labedaea rhizosphaerae]TDP97393.1 S-adenosyl methyltransferase [Labedaea rhizosphaerae]